MEKTQKYMHEGNVNSLCLEDYETEFMLFFR